MFIIDAIVSLMDRVYIALAWQIYRLYAFAWKIRPLVYKRVINGIVFGGLSLLLVLAIYVNTNNGEADLITLLGDQLLFYMVAICWLALAHFDRLLRRHERELRLAMARTQQ
ncbi:hypothetical protein KBD20_03710 [Candidatus Saccharibacteria bacterium]|nr:hypothetical protein [Candidatus Saccharibacteria bacterium]